MRKIQNYYEIFHSEEFFNRVYKFLLKSKSFIKLNAFYQSNASNFKILISKRCNDFSDFLHLISILKIQTPENFKIILAVLKLGLQITRDKYQEKIT